MTITGQRRFFLRSLVLLILALAWFAPTLVGQTLAAAPTVQWSRPSRVPGYLNKTFPPILVTDRDNTVHAFLSQSVGTEVGITYRRWQPLEGWSKPVDVILSPRAGQAMIQGALLDSKGMMHVIFFGGNDQGGDLYYSSAAAVDAGNAHAWSPPRLIARAAIFSPATALTGDDHGNLYALFSGSDSGNGLYMVRSTDAGKTWSSPLAVSLTGDPDTYPGALGLYLDSSAHLHVAWAVWRPPFGGEVLYYARLNTISQEWSIPVVLSRPIAGGSPDYPVLISYHDKLLLIYQENWTVGSMMKLMRLSSDDGSNWGDAVPAFPPLVGGNGPAVLFVDSNDVLHAILANRITDDSHGMWHSVWEGDRWSEAQSIITGAKSAMFDPTIPQATILQGNLILATWENEGGLNGIWYSYAQLDAPGLTIEPLPTPMPSPNPSPTPTALLPAAPAIPTAVSLPPVTTKSQPASQSSPMLPLLVATIPVLGLIALVALFRGRS